MKDEKSKEEKGNKMSSTTSNCAANDSDSDEEDEDEDEDEDEEDLDAALHHPVGYFGN